MTTQSVAQGTVHTVPTDLRNALTANNAALGVWNSLTPLARNEWICWVTFVKKEETRSEHVRRVVSQTQGGKASTMLLDRLSASYR